MKNNEMPKSTVPDAPGVGCVIAGTDGTMIPLADTGDGVIGADAKRGKAGGKKPG